MSDSALLHKLSLLIELAHATSDYFTFRDEQERFNGEPGGDMIDWFAFGRLDSEKELRVRRAIDKLKAAKLI
jgi:hypothetical protein